MTRLTQDQVSAALANNLRGLGSVLPDTANSEAAVYPNEIIARVSASILSKVAQYLAANSELLPPKSAVLEAVDQAIDAALALVGRPLLTSLINRPIKAAIAKAVDSMYDAILNPVPPATEV